MFKLLQRKDHDSFETENWLNISRPKQSSHYRMEWIKNVQACRQGIGSHDLSHWKQAL